MAITIKPSAYKEIRKDFGRIRDAVESIQNLFEHEYHSKLYIFIRLNTTDVDPRRARIQLLLDNIRPEIVKLQHELEFIINKTKTEKICEYIQFLDDLKDFSFYLDQTEQQMDEQIA